MTYKLYFNKNLKERWNKKRKGKMNERATTKLSHRQNGTVTLENGQFLKKLDFHLPGSQQSTFGYLS